MNVVIYHNPRCSKSRQTLELLRERGLQPEVVEYLKNPPDAATLDDILAHLGLEPRALMRKGEAVYRELSLKDLYPLLVRAGLTTAVVMLLVAAALVSGWLITVADLPGKLVQILEPLIATPTLLLFALMVLVLIVGTAMDMTPTILILTPVLMPVVKAAGIDPIYFGVLFMINNAIGLITPPVGTVLNVVAGVSRMSISDVTRGVWPFVIAQSAVLFLLVLFPSLVTVPARWFAG